MQPPGGAVARIGRCAETLHDKSDRPGERVRHTAFADRQPLCQRGSPRAPHQAQPNRPGASTPRDAAPVQSLTAPPRRPQGLHGRTQAGPPRPTRPGALSPWRRLRRGHLLLALVLHRPDGGAAGDDVYGAALSARARARRRDHRRLHPRPLPRTRRRAPGALGDHGQFGRRWARHGAHPAGDRSRPRPRRQRSSCCRPGSTSP